MTEIDKILDVIDVGLQSSTESGDYVPPAPGDFDYEGPTPVDNETAHDARRALTELEGSSSFRAPDDGRPWGLAPFSWTTMDEDPMQESNYDYVLGELAALDSDVYDASVKHWIGSVRERLILVPLDNPAVVERLTELIDAYESYSILDEEDYQRRSEELVLDAVRWYDDVGTEERAGEVLAWLADERDISVTHYELPDEDEVREALLALGYVDPDPERGEEELTGVEITALVLSDIYGTVPWHPTEDYVELYVNRN
jgi:hypothetical protein